MDAKHSRGDQAHIRHAGTSQAKGAGWPRTLYGTAWKEGQTASLVRRALKAGFRGFDTANQRKHYVEADVGLAIEEACLAGEVHREALFIQTKFTYPAAQDARLPYDLGAQVETQVAQSVASSLAHLRVDTLDSLLLHGPSQARGLSETDKRAWRAMEAATENGTVRQLGISNVQASQLASLLDWAERPPAFVQNRCFAVTGWDSDVRAVCREAGVTYQGFSLLTANVEVLQHPPVVALAESLDIDVPALIFAFARQLGMLPLTGTTRAEHMQTQLASERITLDSALVEDLERIAAPS